METIVGYDIRKKKKQSIEDGLEQKPTQSL